jgi:hypothetical protein
MAIRSPQHKVHEEAVDLTLVLAGDRTNFEGGLLNEIVADHSARANGVGLRLGWCWLFDV